MNESVDKVRRNAYRNKKDKAVRKAIKGTRWLLMANRGDLEETEGKTERLDMALKLN
ncbi:MAG: transposase [Bacteroides sp.]|nr:transposase [Bacteroides sp.]